MWPSRRLELSFASETFIGWRNAAIAAVASRISDSGSLLVTDQALAAVKSTGEPKNCPLLGRQLKFKCSRIQPAQHDVFVADIFELNGSGIVVADAAPRSNAAERNPQKATRRLSYVCHCMPRLR